MQFAMQTYWVLLLSTKVPALFVICVIKSRFHFHTRYQKIFMDHFVQTQQAAIAHSFFFLNHPERSLIVTLGGGSHCFLKKNTNKTYKNII